MPGPIVTVVVEMTGGGFAPVLAVTVAASFSFRASSYGHIYNVTFCGFPKLVKKRNVGEFYSFRTLYAKPFRRNEGAFEMYTHNACSLFVPHCSNNSFKLFFHFVGKVNIRHRN